MTLLIAQATPSFGGDPNVYTWLGIYPGGGELAPWGVIVNPVFGNPNWCEHSQPVSSPDTQIVFTGDYSSGGDLSQMNMDSLEVGSIHYLTDSTSTHLFFDVVEGAGSRQFMISGTGIVNDSPNGQDLVLDNTNSLDFYNSATITGDVGISIPDADFDANYSTFVAFSDNSSAGTANFIITSYKANVFFQDFSTAGTSTITINGLDSKPVFWEYSVYCSADFTGSSSADHATINVSGGGTTTPSFVEFSGTSSAGNATITTLPGGVDADRANYVQFNDSATAGSATITLSGNNGQHVQFGDTSTAGNATITANGDSSSVVIKGSATGALASIDLAHSTTFLDISKLDVDSTHIGSLEGWGQVRLGLKNLIVGDNNRSTTFGGEVSGGSGANGLEKSGTGTLTLIGNNSYVGHTTLDAGTLCLGSSGALGTTGLVDFQGGTLQYTANNTTDYSSRFVGSTTQKYRVDTNGQNVTWAADLNTNYGLTKSGLGTLTLAGHNTISDLVAINAGVLNLGSNEALDGVGGIRFGGGTLTLTGANSYTGATSVTAGTLALVGGSQTSAITVSDGASLGFTLGSPTTSTQTLTFSGATAKVRFTGTPSVASYTLMTASAITGTPVLDPAIPGCTLAVEGGGTILKLYATLSGYAAWAATNAPTGTAGDDYDGDGVSNGVEYLLGGTRFSNDRGKLPQLTTTGGNMVFSFIRDQQSIDGVTTVNIEVGTDLATWPTRYAVPAVAAANDPGVTVVKDSPVAGQDTVTLTIPQTSNTKQFARLQVTPP